MVISRDHAESRGRVLKNALTVSPRTVSVDIVVFLTMVKLRIVAMSRLPNRRKLLSRIGSLASTAYLSLAGCTGERAKTDKTGNNHSSPPARSMNSIPDKIGRVSPRKEPTLAVVDCDGAYQTTTGSQHHSDTMASDRTTGSTQSKKMADGGDPSPLIETNDDAKFLNHITSPTKGAIVQLVLSHPKKAPSLTEIQYMTPEKADATISDHLSDLVDRGILEKQKIPRGERPRDGPNTFYSLSDRAIELLSKHNVYVDMEEELETKYENVKKTEKIQRYEQASRGEANPVA